MNSKPINRDDRYCIIKLDQPINNKSYAVVNQDQNTILTLSRTFDRACRHIFNSTGHWARCYHHKGEFGKGMEGTYQAHSKTVFATTVNLNVYGINVGCNDLYQCEICQRRIKHSRLIARNVRKPKEYGPTMRKRRRKLIRRNYKQK